MSSSFYGIAWPHSRKVCGQSQFQKIGRTARSIVWSLSLLQWLIHWRRRLGGNDDSWGADKEKIDYFPSRKLFVKVTASCERAIAAVTSLCVICHALFSWHWRGFQIVVSSTVAFERLISWLKFIDAVSIVSCWLRFRWSELERVLNISYYNNVDVAVNLTEVNTAAAACNVNNGLCGTFLISHSAAAAEVIILRR